eukprot:CAMPEP_0198722538 /NCGR_PEP_ID=MMETSP1475-20131203/239_1 /TAXON_ID= ORGANISM="Unidentified sp., Strain CCMP1999" /NCGR_SAMPLE_ID=MMETSP1475 /ASSEMBLY_ACC=CAM_ASM_001111 /LENGTH=198 /DNA_ID=CAMNT_0044483449 /DNA_START=145 /DNA_END=741 /DNA_ORIENTATION=-
MSKDEGDMMSAAARLGTELTTLAVLMSPMAANAADAVAAPEGTLKSLFKTKVLSLAHPVAMWTILGTSVYTFYLGWKVRTLRTTGDSDTKKKLAKEKPGPRHFQISATLLAAMTFFTFEGMANTYTRTGKLFPGPHLYNGLGLVFCMALMSSLVPQMNKNKIWAKNAHFTLAFAALGLFGWQAQSGLQITFKLLGIQI